MTYTYVLNILKKLKVFLKVEVYLKYFDNVNYWKYKVSNYLPFKIGDFIELEERYYISGNNKTEIKRYKIVDIMFDKKRHSVYEYLSDGVYILQSLDVKGAYTSNAFDNIDIMKLAPHDKAMDEFNNDLEDLLK
jgi:hypothetical protein